MRCEIENLIDLYHRIQTPQPPHVTRDALALIADRAGDILDALSPDVEAALLDAWSNAVDTPGRRLHATKLVMEHRTALSRLRTWATAAAKHLPPGKRGADADNIRWMVRGLDAIVTKCTAGQHLDRSKRMVAFALDACRLADSEITDGTVTAAIDALKRAKQAPE
jgi:hypothetical protein